MLLLVLPASVNGDLGAEAPRQVSRRAGMIEAIEDYVRRTSLATGRRAFDERAMQAMATVRRHEFVPEELGPFAY